jgi:hypothetical protein
LGELVSSLDAIDHPSMHPLFASDPAQGDYQGVRRRLARGDDVEERQQIPLSGTPYWVIRVMLCTALCLAAARDHTSVARLLVEEGHADPDRQASSGATALMFAAMQGNLDLVTFLVEQANANIHLQDAARGDALSYALGSWDGAAERTRALTRESLSAATFLVIHGAQPVLAPYPPNSRKLAALQQGLALRAQVAEHRRHRRTTVLGWLQEQGVPADVGQIVVAGMGEAVVSETLRELGISL